MNCKLKLHSKGFYQQILGAVTVLKFLQKLALDFPYICLQFFPGNFYRQMYRKLKYKHCNFSRVCLLVKMASKTVTRSTERNPAWISFARWLWTLVDFYQRGRERVIASFLWPKTRLTLQVRFLLITENRKRNCASDFPDFTQSAEAVEYAETRWWY